MRKLIALFAVAILSLATPSYAAEAQSIGDPVVEARVKKLSEELRCLTCMGQSIADSQSGFSEDMKREIREMIAKGKTDAQIMEFMVQRYGDFVLYRPPVKETTWLLWFGPFVFFILALWGLVAKLKKRNKSSAKELTSEEKAKAAQLLNESREKSA